MARPQHPKWQAQTGGQRSQLLDDGRATSAGLALVSLPVVGLALLGAQGAIPEQLLQHGMYLPLVLAAYFFGVSGSLVVAFAAAVAVGPLRSAFGVPFALDGWLLTLAMYLAVAVLAGRLLGLLDERRRKVIRTQIATLKSFAVAVETEDEPAGEHCERVAANARTLGEAIGLGGYEREELYWAGLLHDIGKVTVPREILRKPGGLTLEEYLVMRRHARLGANLLSSIESFKRVADGVGSHHERFDGSGYPGGLRGEDIPLYGRILAVVDVFEALSSDRPYRKALTREDAIEELRRSAGSQFDPKLVATYERLYREGRVQVASQPQAVAEQQPRLELLVTQQPASGPG
ncbi:MAG: HD-GYP domain-containing protein [Trueperaceae bacterium]